MRRTIILLVSGLLFLASVTLVYAAPAILIEPHAFDPPDPVVLTSPATFNITVASGTGYDPQIFLVMTEACYNGLTDDVKVEWPGPPSGFINFSTADFTAVNSGFIPPSTPSANYQVSSLQSHLGVPNTEDIYYALGPFLAGPLTQTNQTFTVTLPSTTPRMLVYAIAKSAAGADYDSRVPNSRPGFVIPEPATLFATLVSVAGLGAYAYKRRKK
jgi:hypothetical protein